MWVDRRISRNESARGAPFDLCRHICPLHADAIIAVVGFRSCRFNTAFASVKQGASSSVLYWLVSISLCATSPSRENHPCLLVWSVFVVWFTLSIDKKYQWYRQYADYGLVVPICLTTLEGMHIELDSIDSVNHTTNTLHTNKHGSFSSLCE